MRADGSQPSLVWPRVDETRALERGEVHVWAWSLLADGVEELARGLSEAERLRAGRFVHRRDWRRYVVAHARMRDVLAGYVGVSARTIAFAAAAHGKPYVVGAEVQVNLSHSEELALLAVGRGVEVGVDVEWVRVGGLAAPLDQLSTEERRYLLAVPEERRTLEFCRCWVGKEALLKGVGVGLLEDLGSFTVLPGWERAEVCGHGVGMAGLGAWRMKELAPADGYVGCLAVRGEGVSVRYFQLV